MNVRKDSTQMISMVSWNLATWTVNTENPLKWTMRKPYNMKGEGCGPCNMNTWEQSNMNIQYWKKTATRILLNPTLWLMNIQNPATWKENIKKPATWRVNTENAAICKPVQFTAMDMNKCALYTITPCISSNHWQTVIYTFVRILIRQIYRRVKIVFSRNGH